MSSKASGSQNRKRKKRWTKENETCGNALRSFLMNNNVPPEVNMNENLTARSESDSDDETLINYHDQDYSDHVIFLVMRRETYVFKGQRKVVLMLIWKITVLMNLMFLTMKLLMKQLSLLLRP